MRSKDFVDHWWKQCNGPFFRQFQFREQDLLNIIAVYGNYNVTCLDYSDSWFGLISKSEWDRIRIKGNKLVVPVDQTYNSQEKIVKVIHWAGGNVQKMSFDTRFHPIVSKYLKEITKWKKD